MLFVPGEHRVLCDVVPAAAALEVEYDKIVVVGHEALLPLLHGTLWRERGNKRW